MTNYTLPGHVFYPGLVIRTIVENDGLVEVHTEGRGNEGFFKKILNVDAAPFVWIMADGSLRNALYFKYRIMYKPPKPDE